MNIKGLFAIALVALLGVANGESAVQEADTAVTRELQIADFSTKLALAINSKRAEKGLKAVCINKKLMKAAQVQADYMAQTNKVGTTGSGGSTPTIRYATQHIATSKSAEMVAAGQTTVNAVVDTWVKSAGAYLFSDLKFIGPGYRYDATKEYKHYWVLDMANADGEVCM
ncbi:hypothetical protein PHYSODRAFT_325279 [Phytophthora sojae]|uniref:SCP domain-containing protein n=1 Tax=Phytophthora sojae (strain P6497) TaxID=1094619 RepID=G4YS05_PHYSP|nr:hypothetical protein PHYSODRAFT_478976 [Phytophthora sojae]XP_009519430.1 hypothetical protein PHYSODRAFT_325279 [Phytophthora sojae]EGZ24139.1 hypothetical protein PHYSODRAFT_478976 [Phytophthora sojae]EGZ24142.1 hypothetical protein PHYSODRAFT_325279 [Phytophthora sojae]|eukprot:XP_009519427.1 hypothetical protein PHYSODRAFT_478976 [Phytophthora sojae]